MFWSKPRVSDDMTEWIAECFDWFDARFPPPPAPILPTKEFFRAGSGQDQKTAEQVLADVKRHLKFDPPILLTPMERLSGEYRHSYQALSEAAGTYEETDEGRLISYDPEAMTRPVGFINTMAHEVMHARLAGMTHLVPGGDEAHELATDLGCIIAGFGVFQLRAADEVGWSGYLTQESRAYALAFFLDARGLGIDAVSQHMSSRCNRYLKRAFKELR